MLLGTLEFGFQFVAVLVKHVNNKSIEKSSVSFPWEKNWNDGIDARLAMYPISFEELGFNKFADIC